MTPGLLAILLIAIGIILLIAELLLPTAGMLGILGGVAITGAIIACFTIHRYVGLAALLLTMLITPLVWTAFVNLWPRTAIGRKLVLQHVEPTPPPPLVSIGDTGVAVSQ